MLCEVDSMRWLHSVLNQMGSGAPVMMMMMRVRQSNEETP